MYPLDRSPGAPAHFCITRFRATSCLNISTGFTVFPAVGGGVISFHRIIQKIDNSYYYIFTRYFLSFHPSISNSIVDNRFITCSLFPIRVFTYTRKVFSNTLLNVEMFL